jgi:hypothetical protein
MRVPDVAAYIGESVAWTRTALASGAIPGGRKVRNRWMVLQDDVDAWLDAGRPERAEPEGEEYAPPPRVMSRTI